MNIGLVTSYIIAGILLLGIMFMNINVQKSSAELTFTQTKKAHINAIAEILTYDITKAGYTSTGLIDSAIVSADSNRITFKGNIDNSADGTVETVTWHWTTIPVTSTSNPDDYMLKRTVNGVETEIGWGVVQFKINYYATIGGSTPLLTPVTGAAISSIRQIEFEIMLESDNVIATASGMNEPVRTFMKKRFSPVNLNN